ncbi:MAG TPA: S-methyl-5-thioribose-1-phosphate isomerase [Bryobacteraceae bacterium]|nr:S-methyl-5-thioribose-1-phosphate isomerase [Bryobacteraceae bacterium]HOL71987.1 S-methyl-5-thioribose-1-phosphate isomerase [Bryobacteraceae bacterium]HOQ44016.1 S-methyl-5-thioribose-1-phosphate isomerase [Bryobacteraceae bacterium]HPU70334.1 S-methyl-5-thioribose-1-phosphate isomerase [Bryobacteraceae bacterium]
MVETIQWTSDGVVMIDQTRLPREEVYVTCRDYREVADAIRTMVIRGAPAIGVAAAMGVALGALRSTNLDAEFDTICDTLARTRPTAVNLFWAIDRMKRVYRSLQGCSVETIRERLVAEAIEIRREDIAINEAIGRHGAELIPDGKTVLTHCNAGALATAGYGTALGVIRAAVAAGKKIDVFADETRPFLQGARLTVWELMRDGIPATLITDNMAGHFLKTGRIGCVVVGADRIAANGDVANKIGTYSVAVLARENGVPFYVAAPVSTLDLTLASGDLIPIEQRPAEEVTHVFEVPIAPEGVAVENPAFDVTPNRYVTAIITERGIARPPYTESLKKLVG